MFLTKLCLYIYQIFKINLLFSILDDIIAGLWIPKSMPLFLVYVPSEKLLYIARIFSKPEQLFKRDYAFLKGEIKHSYLSLRK